MDILISGALGGMLMGMIAVAHISLLLVFKPPRVLLRKASEDGMGNTPVIASLSIAFFWAILGIVAAFGFDAIESAAPSSVPTIPSAAYLVVVFVLALMFGIPAAVFLRDRLLHLGIQLVLIVGIFGWLIPNLAMAQRP